MKSILVTLALLLTGNILFAQNAHFITSGTINFERTVNVYGLIKDQMGKTPNDYDIKMFEEYKKTDPQFRKMQSTLMFDKNKTLFVPVPSEKIRLMYDDNPSATQSNTVYTDIAAGQSTTQKEVYDEVFLVKDSTRKIKWKLTSETREIAGYTCRRANAIIMDSVYVVAFYTDKIHVNGGPETFTGLPGMILGVALPHDNVTWFATKVTEATGSPTDLIPPKKGKPVNNKQLFDILKQVMKGWGPTALHELKVFTM